MMKKLATFVLLVLAALALTLPTIAWCGGWGQGGWGQGGWGGLGWGWPWWGGLGGGGAPGLGPGGCGFGNNLAIPGPC